MNYSPEFKLRMFTYRLKIITIRGYFYGDRYFWRLFQKYNLFTEASHSSSSGRYFKTFYCDVENNLIAFILYEVLDFVMRQKLKVLLF